MSEGLKKWIFSLLLVFIRGESNDELKMKKVVVLNLCSQQSREEFCKENQAGSSSNHLMGHPFRDYPHAPWIVRGFSRTQNETPFTLYDFMKLPLIFMTMVFKSRVGINSYQMAT
jgi:hypothetical protein